MKQRRSPSLAELTARAVAFRDARLWKQFHTPKDLAMSISAELGELMEHLLWKSGKEAEEYIAKHRPEIGDELADILHGVLLLAEEMKIDLGESFERKMRENERKYPIGKSRGSARKYREL